MCSPPGGEHHRGERDRRGYRDQRRQDRVGAGEDASHAEQHAASPSPRDLTSPALPTHVCLTRPQGGGGASRCAPSGKTGGCSTAELHPPVRGDDGIRTRDLPLCEVPGFEPQDQRRPETPTRHDRSEAVSIPRLVNELSLDFGAPTSLWDFAFNSHARWPRRGGNPAGARPLRCSDERVCPRDEDDGAQDLRKGRIAK